MSGEFRDVSEFKAYVEMEAGKRVEQVWSVFQDPTLKQEFAQMGQEEKDVVNEVVKDFVIFQRSCDFVRAHDGEGGSNLVAFRHIKPNGAPEGRHGPTEHYAYRMVGALGATKEYYERTDNNLFERLNTQFDPAIGLPKSDDQNIVQILPLENSNAVLIRCTARTKGSIHDDRPSGWDFNIYTGKDTALVRFLRSEKGIRLLPYIVRNSCAILNPDAAIYVDTSVQDTKEWNVVDFGTLKRTHYPQKGSRTDQGETKDFPDIPSFVGHIRDSGLGGDIQSDMRGKYIPLFSMARDADRKNKANLEYSYPDHLRID